MKIPFVKLKEDATPPKYGTPYAAGADLYACIDAPIVIAPHSSAFIATGIAIELPEGTVGLIYARSGLATKKGLAPANKVGVIDCDYRGELMICLYNHSDVPQTVEQGERIAQMVITPYFTADFEETDILSVTPRGAAGFGSTGNF